VEAETRYHPSSDQLALASTIDDSLSAILPLSRLHTAHQEDPTTWSSLDEIGIFTIGVSEAEGGSALGAAEESLIVMGLGRRLAGPGILATVGAAHAKQSPARGKRVAAGYRRGDRVIIVAEPGAEFVLVREQHSAALYEARSLASRVIDNRLWLAGVRETEAAALGTPVVSFDEAQSNRLRLIDAAALAGMAAATLDMSVAYVGIREQFGRAIGSFQAVKHHCATMAMAARCARDQTTFAALAIDQGRADAQMQIECAFLVAGAAALDNSAKNIQLHGGIGFSDEADPHLFVKRTQLQIAIAGGLEAATARIANTPVDW
jgi:alkylation response protein AidB-like acyl-CoA dehydrogenase